MPKRVNAEAFKLYPLPSFTLIPLHRYTDVSTTKAGKQRKDGKRPLDFNWTRAKYISAKVLLQCVKENRNIGIRLRSDQLVIDVDPRNGGDEGFMALCRDLGLSSESWPTVITGSGGWHYYMRKPADLLIVDTLKDYKGVEFKSSGRQVVACGSIHPDTHDYYEQDKLTPGFDEMPMAPKKLLRLIQRPQRDSITTGAGDYTQEDIARVLADLDVTEFRDHQQWLNLMMACHYASSGDARHEFVEWSTQDPPYADDAELIGRRWDSLHTDRPGGITTQTLKMIMSEHGATRHMKATDAASEFDDVPADQLSGYGEHKPPTKTKKERKPRKKASADDSEFEGDDDDGEHVNPGGWSDEAISELETLNDRYCAVMDGSKFRIAELVHDEILKRDLYIRINPNDFEKLHSNFRIERSVKGLSKGSAPTVKLGQAWIEWPKRRTSKGIIFDPSGKEHKDHLNLWKGFRYSASASPEGSWSRLKELIFEVLCNGEDKSFEYVINWMRFLFQTPEHPAEVAMVFKGGQGVGKGTLGKALVHLIGHHALAIASPDLITGRFNAHLQDVIFLFADEAIRPHDTAAKSRLKAMLTESLVTVEGKGRDAVQARNYLHVMMASNEEWVVPADSTDGYVRRFFVSEANTKWQHQHSRFQALWDELHANDGMGFRRMLWDLQTEELPELWHPRNLVVTTALRDQKIRSLDPLRQYLFDLCKTGVLPFPYQRGPWETKPVRVFQEIFRDHFSDWCRRGNINPSAMGRGNAHFLLQELQRIWPYTRVGLRDVPEDEFQVHFSPSDGRAPSIEFPPLTACRNSFDTMLGEGIDWAGTQNDFG